MNYIKRCLFLFASFLCVTTIIYAQNPTIRKVPLSDISDFRPQAGNWQIVGDLTMNPTVDIHEQHEQVPVDTRKKKKKAKLPPAPEKPKAVTFKLGAGILMNLNDDVKKDNLVSVFENGDIELELEVMVPKGSNSGIYLQGRYELQLFDSWRVQNPTFSDIGGIYRNWETEKEKIYMGKAPLINSANAPGMWQKIKISFQAPNLMRQVKKLPMHVLCRLN